ncbi:unnamed protein product [Coregonus sp. 'balchen']|nr:unnamed protein product [Coregonus sp. 'balchen']
MEEEVSLRVLPMDPADRGTQRVRLGPGLMSSLGLALGSPVLVALSGGSCLCTAWPRPDLADGFIQIDMKCCSPNLILNKATPTHLTLSLPLTPSPSPSSSPLPPSPCRSPSLTPVSCSKLKGIRVSVVVQSLEFRKTTPPSFIHELVKDMLKGTYVHQNHVIDVGDYDTDIKLIVIESLNPESTVAGLVTSKTGVSACLREMLRLPLQYPATLGSLGLSCPRGVLLAGPPGVGKTLLVRCLVGEVVGSRPGESEERLRAVFGRARAAAEEGPCVLFLDELDSLCPRRTGSSAPENRLVAQLLTLMDGMDQSDRFLIVGATNQPDSLDPALRRPGRFDREVVIGAPTAQQRLSILSVLCQAMPVCVSVDWAELAQRTTGYVGADLSALCREAAMLAIRHNTQTVRPSCLRGSLGRTDLPAVSWEQIGGLEEVKLKLQQAFVRLGLSRPRGVLLYGPPGCAKTTLVRAAATSSHCSFLSVSGADLYSPYVGDSEKALAQARACAPSILFLDEVDSLIGSRSEGHAPQSAQTRLLSVLLNELDGVGFRTLERRGAGKTLQAEGVQERHQQEQLEYQEVCNKEVMIVAATNRPDSLDSALLRPGRLDQIIYVPPPDLQARVSILQVCTEKMPLDDDVCLEELAEQTDLYSGADLENLCREAALSTLQEESMEASSIKHRYFLQSLQRMTPSLSTQQLQTYKNLFR